jgi:hypothetical protein
MSARYWLSRNWAVCSTGSALVCFNIVTWQCVPLSPAASDAVSRLVVGWPVIATESTQSSERSADPRPVGDVVRSLLDMEVLVHKRALGKDPTPISLPRADSALLDEYEIDGGPISWRGLIRFARATFVAGLKGGRPRSLSNYIARQMQTQSAPTETEDAGRLMSNLEDVKLALAAFLRMRPILPKVKHQQLFEQMILFKFLRYHGIRPIWVMGISLDQGGCHSWLQYRGFVVDDVPTRTLGFIPIAAFS